MPYTKGAFLGFNAGLLRFGATMAMREITNPPNRRPLPIIGGGILDKRNDGFSGNPERVIQFNQSQIGQQILSGPPESFSFLQRLNPIRFPRPQSPYQNDMESKARAIANAENEAVESEGNIWVNGKLIPGIFQGCKVSGGINLLKFSQAGFRKGLDNTADKDLAKRYESLSLFQLDGGRKPFRGSASFIFLKDYFSSPLEKAREFIRIIAADLSIKDSSAPKRVCTIKGLLIGADGPFVASYFKINDYSIEAPPGMGGRLMGAFEFEQYAAFNTELRWQEPDTRNTSDSERALQMEELTNPMSAPPETGEG